MKNIPVYIILVFIFSGLAAQEGQTDYSTPGEPYPASVSYEGLTAAEANFIGLFRDENIGNLHLYASADPMPGTAYFFKGEAIKPTFKDLLPGEIAPLTHLQGGQPHAVLSLRGDGEELYVLRLPGQRFQNQLSLYDMENGQLRKLMTLAYYQCSNSRCEQQDSWVQDVDGDARLDIITKKKITNRKGKEQVSARVYLMKTDGTFRRTKNINIEEKDYLFENITAKNGSHNGL